METAAAPEQGAPQKEAAQQGSPPKEPPDDGGERGASSSGGGDGGGEEDAPAPAVVETDPTKRYIRVRPRRRRAGPRVGGPQRRRRAAGGRPRGAARPAGPGRAWTLCAAGGAAPGAPPAAAAPPPAGRHAAVGPRGRRGLPACAHACSRGAPRPRPAAGRRARPSHSHAPPARLTARAPSPCPSPRPPAQYDVVLGRGAFKTVYKAFDEAEGIEVAWNQVKVNDLVMSAAERERLFAEIRVLKQLKHKNIMSFCDSWLDQKNLTVNFITELFTSGTLRQ
jgi:hypothetical protein